MTGLHSIINAKTPPPRPQEISKIQDDRSVIPETISIKMAEGENSCQAGSFLETPVPLHILRCWDQSPQSEVQLARAIVSSWDFKREEKSAEHNLVGIAAEATKFSTPVAIESVAHKDKKRLWQAIIEKMGRAKVDWGPEAKTIWGRSISKILHLMNGRSVRLHSFTPSEIMLGYVPEWKNMYGKAQDVMPGITLGAMQEAEQEKAKDMEKRRKGLGIEKVIGKKRKNNELLWSDQYWTICQVMKEIQTARPDSQGQEQSSFTFYFLVSSYSRFLLLPGSSLFYMCAADFSFCPRLSFFFDNWRGNERAGRTR